MNKTKAIQQQRINGQPDHNSAPAPCAGEEDSRTNEEVVRAAMRRRSLVQYKEYKGANESEMKQAIEDFERIFPAYASFHEFSEADILTAREFWQLPENIGSALFDMKTEVAVLGIDVPSREDFRNSRKEAEQHARQLARAAQAAEKQAETVTSFSERRLESIPHDPGDGAWVVTVVDLFPIERQESILLAYGHQYLATKESTGSESEARRTANMWLLQEAETFDRERFANSEERRRMAAGFRPQMATHH